MEARVFPEVPRRERFSVLLCTKPERDKSRAPMAAAFVLHAFIFAGLAANELHLRNSATSFPTNTHQEITFDLLLVPASRLAERGDKTSTARASGERRRSRSSTGGSPTRIPAPPSLALVLP